MAARTASATLVVGLLLLLGPASEGFRAPVAPPRRRLPDRPRTASLARSSSSSSSMGLGAHHYHHQASRLAAAAAGGLVLEVRRSHGRRGGLVSMHMGHHHHHGHGHGHGHDHDHDHHHHGHGHGHGHHHDHPATAATGVKGFVQYIVSVLKQKRQTIAGVLAGAVAVVAVRSYKGMTKFTSADFGILALVATFVLAVETTKSYLTALRENLASIAAAWRHHRSLRLLQSDRPLAAGGPAVPKLAAGARDADRVTWLGIYANLGLFAIKAAAGIVGRSAAMIADAGHTLSDLVSDMVTLWAVRMSALPPDEDHPYGHGRFEAVGSLGVSALLLLTAWHIAAHAYDKLQHCLVLPTALSLPAVLSSLHTHIPAAFATATSPLAALLAAARGGHTAGGLSVSCSAAPSLFAVGAALASIVVKELLYQVTASVGLKHNSQVLLANAWHHRSDAISSVMALGGIVAARAGLPALDPIAGILVTAMIGLTGMQIFLDSMNQLTDTVESAAIPGIRRVADTVEGVLETSDIRARRMGPQLLVDLRIRVDSQMSASAVQQVADQVRWRIRKDFPHVSEVLVHTKTEPGIPCPVANDLRQPSAIEQDVRARLRGDILALDPRVTALRKVVVHYVAMQPTVEVLLTVDAALTVAEAGAVARRVQAVVEGVRDVTRAEVHLDLTGGEDGVSAAAAAAAGLGDQQLPPPPPPPPLPLGAAALA